MYKYKAQGTWVTFDTLPYTSKNHMLSQDAAWQHGTHRQKKSPHGSNTKNPYPAITYTHTHIKKKWHPPDTSLWRPSAVAPHRLWTAIPAATAEPCSLKSSEIPCWHLRRNWTHSRKQSWPCRPLCHISASPYWNKALQRNPFTIRVRSFEWWELAAFTTCFVLCCVCSVLLVYWTRLLPALLFGWWHVEICKYRAINSDQWGDQLVVMWPNTGQAWPCSDLDLSLCIQMYDYHGPFTRAII